MQPNSGIARATARWTRLATGALLAGVAVAIGGRFHYDLAAANARFTSGDAIAQVGHSGNSSEPHLHINAQDPGTADAPFSGAPIPIRINGRYVARNDRFVVQSAQALR